MITPTRDLLRGVARGGAPKFLFLSNVLIEPLSPIFVALMKGTMRLLRNMWLSNCGMDDAKVEFLASALLERRNVPADSRRPACGAQGLRGAGGCPDQGGLARIGEAGPVGNVSRG